MTAARSLASGDDVNCRNGGIPARRWPNERYCKPIQAAAPAKTTRMRSCRSYVGLEAKDSQSEGCGVLASFCELLHWLRSALRDRTTSVNPGQCARIESLNYDNCHGQFAAAAGRGP